MKIPDKPTFPVPGSSISTVNQKNNTDKPVSDNSHFKLKIEQQPEQTAKEMIKEPEKMGEWKDKKGLEETTDNTMGGDIRYALTTKNIDFLKRLKWGGLTISELREVSHRIRELERTMAKNPDVLSGKIIETKA